MLSKAVLIWQKRTPFARIGRRTCVLFDRAGQTERAGITNVYNAITWGPRNEEAAEGGGAERMERQSGTEGGAVSRT